MQKKCEYAGFLEAPGRRATAKECRYGLLYVWISSSVRHDMFSESTSSGSTCTIIDPIIKIEKSISALKFDHTPYSPGMAANGMHLLAPLQYLLAVVVRQESGSTPVLMDSANKSAKTVDSSLAAYFRGRLERPSGPEYDFSLSDWKAFVTLTSFIKFSGAVRIGRVNVARSGALQSWMK